VTINQTESSVQKHTPGPWKVVIDGTYWGRGPAVVTDYPYYEDDAPCEIADCGTSEVNERGEWTRTQDADDIEANARLIAAAPDLLEALKVVASTLEKLEAGLAAKVPPSHIAYVSKQDAANVCRALRDRSLAAIAKAEGGAA